MAAVSSWSFGLFSNQKTSASSDGSHSERSSHSGHVEVETDGGPRPSRPPTPPSSEDLGLANDEQLYIAVDKKFKSWKANLIWVLKNTPRKKKIVFVHVYVPAQMIPIMGAWFPADQLKNTEVQAYRELERRKVEKALNEYIDRCLNFKEVKPEKIIFEANDVGQGLVDLIAQHKITNLVIGAAADNNYSKKLNKPKSKKALTVQKHAHLSSKIWFVCKGNLICTREAGPDAFGTRQSSGPSPGQSERLSLQTFLQTSIQPVSYFPGVAQEASRQKSVSTDTSSYKAAMEAAPKESLSESPSPGSKDGIYIDLWDGGLRESRSSQHSASKDSIVIDFCGSTSRSSKSSEYSFRLMEDDVRSNTSSISLKDFKYEAESSFTQSMKDIDQLSSTSQDMVKEKEMVKATKKISDIEIKHSKEFEERISELSKQTDDAFEELQMEIERRAALEKQIDDLNYIIHDFEKKLSEAHYLLISLKTENIDIQRDRDDAVREAEHLRNKIGQMSTSSDSVESFMIFSYADLEVATGKFGSSVKIGEGGYGCMYKGLLCQKTVAIKMLNSQGMKGQSEFHKEVDALSRLRHPNLVNLIGACPEAWALVYDYLPNGSLEDRLSCKDNTPPLTWQARVQITCEICLSLNFLHSNKQLNVVHGDLKPANILLDENFASKLTDFGIYRLVQSTMNTTSFYRATHAMGTFVYLDPEFLSSGDITPLSDIYSFGVIVLQLLTGRSAFGINRAVQDAIDTGSLHEILDGSAGHWPYNLTMQLAHLGLRCTEVTRKSRPDAVDAWKVLEPLMKSVSSKSLPPLPSRLVPENSIFQSSYPSFIDKF